MEINDDEFFYVIDSKYMNRVKLHRSLESVREFYDQYLRKPPYGLNKTSIVKAGLLE
ncbi:hypothetical protein BDZ91DRAFT_754938 [Kalaharituber pfeilii]|nr:hypothetical protein BDZ91DRAFT_754938 [Kalaharituber pfeilii]